ncbi:MAG TPA: translocation/assembly module TamB domain-containing protein, partial [Steroidobacteraceae bacterium]|nr:translocation/assembly module TamB domain-containing protein [Steroidobacteraceae bacterium]
LLFGKVAIRADLSGSTAALRIAGDLQAGVAVAGSAPGSLDASFDVKGLPQAPEGRVRARGSVAGASLTLQADVQVDPGRMLRVSALQADWQSLHAQGDLTLAQELDRSHGELRCAIGNLGDFSALLGRHLAGRLAGTLTLMPPADAASTAATSLQVTADGLEVGSLPFNATLAGSGPLHALALQLAAQSTVLGAPATLRAQGHLDARRRSLTVAAATAAIRGIDLNLLQPALLDFTHGLALTGLRLSASDAVLTAAGDLAPQLRLDARLEEATPGLIDAILPGYLSSGSLLGTAQLHGTLAHPLGELRLTGTDLRAAGDAASLPLAQLSAGVDLGADGARVALRSTAGQASHLTIEGTIPWSGPIAVDASGKLDLSRLNPLLEAFGRRISGTLDVDAQVAGTLAAPAVTGALQLHGGTVHDYRHGIDLTQIEGTLAGTQAELRITRLTAHATSGTVGVTGSVGILQPGVPVDLTFTARNAQPFASSIVTASGNADLKLTGTLLHELNLAGAVAVNRATVEIPNSFPPNVAVLDVRRPGQAVAGPSTGINLNLNVTVDAPRQILVRGRGLDAELGGRVQIGGTATAPTIAGGFDLQRGVFTLAGSRLDFSSGRVGFTGTDIKGKIDPTLDFTAQTTALDASVTLRITGVADAPQFELTSVPQLPQDEILARLLFGENAGQLTALQAAQLGAALMTLTGVGTGLNPLVELQKHLGLDRLAVASNDTNTPGNPQNTGTTIEAGRYVTNRIFVNVKQNTTGATQLQMDVDLTSKLKLQTRVGTGTATVQGTTPDNDPGSSVGLSYRFEY